MDRMGLGYDVIARRTRGSIYVSISGFGNAVDTPYRDWPAYASIVEAMSGIYDYKTDPDEPPVTIPVGALGDISSALFAVIGILAALRHRDHTGVGQYVDIAMFDAMVAMTDVVTNFWSMGVRPEPGKGLEVICEGFRASDGYVVVQVVREHQFGNARAISSAIRSGTTTRASRPAPGWAPHLESVIRPARRGVGVAAHEARGRARAHRGRRRRRARATHAADVIADPHVAARQHARRDAAHRRRRDRRARARQPGEAVEGGRRPRDPRAVGRRAHRRGARAPSSASTTPSSPGCATPRRRSPDRAAGPTPTPGRRTAGRLSYNPAAWTSTSRPSSRPSPRRSSASSTSTTTPTSST